MSWMAAFLRDHNFAGRVMAIDVYGGDVHNLYREQIFGFDDRGDAGSIGTK